MSNIQTEKLTKTYGSGSTAVTAVDHEQSPRHVKTPGQLCSGVLLF